MATNGMKLASRGMARVDAKRGGIALLFMGATFGAWYLILPGIQRLIVPSIAAGATGPWVIRPILAVHVCACFLASALSTPLLTRRLGRRWKAQDEAAGTRYDPFDNPLKKVLFFVKGSALLVIYGLSLLFYLLSWSVVSSSGIHERFPWGSKMHRFDQIVALEMIPTGEHSNELERNGPWYNVTFSDGRSFDFGGDNEGSSDQELKEIAQYISDRSGLQWRMR